MAQDTELSSGDLEGLAHGFWWTEKQYTSWILTHQERCEVGQDVGESPHKDVNVGI